MQVKNIIQIMEDFAPLSYQESYDNAGLIIGNFEEEVTGVLICLDCVEEILEEAIENNCNLIIAHHPIIFDELKKINGTTSIERVVIKAIKNNIAIYAAHTNLDNATDGVSFKIAEKLGLINCKVLQPKKNIVHKLVTYCPIDYAEKVRQALFDAGAGHIGNYDECSYNVEGIGTFKGLAGTTPFVGKVGELHQEKEIRIETVVPSHLLQKVIKNMIAAHPYEEVAYDVYQLENTNQNIGSGVIAELETAQNAANFLKQLKTKLKTNCIRHTNLVGKKIKKVAICGGAGSFLLNDAIAANADIFITGDFKYHQFFDAENKLIIADVGHYESEQFIGELIYDVLIKKIPNFAIRLTKINTNPINYL
ncbi:MAG: Nif3-like dinuclear metal center hexameric protein [Bacteroidetes bacterium RIFCSPLOWO2_12_FULL_31_6]|nr:MAG: Nif3-like dinuclear metal center hexameric protein [Bacteroidetes bacterium RIFCSPLOWO2_12_FULL_31_6]